MQAGIYTEVKKEATKVQGYSKAVTTLMVANAYEQDDLQGKEPAAHLTPRRSSYSDLASLATSIA
eukprot:scaffold95084_cov23-Tisochrysis_lutea.AAC.2